MPNIFITADTHFGHEGVCKFLRDDGTKLRPWSCADEMDEALINNWNKNVTKKDKVYMLGDIVINRKALKKLEALNGDLVLIRGNHDIFKLKEYSNYFRDIRGCHVISGMILTHIPIHPESLARFGCNIHGHLHYKRVLDKKRIDPRYHCVSVEHTNFTPISFEDVKKKIREEGGSTEFKKSSSFEVS